MVLGSMILQMWHGAAVSGTRHGLGLGRLPMLVGNTCYLSTPRCVCLASPLPPPWAPDAFAGSLTLACNVLLEYQAELLADLAAGTPGAAAWGPAPLAAHTQPLAAPPPEIQSELDSSLQPNPELAGELRKVGLAGQLASLTVGLAVCYRMRGGERWQQAGPGRSHHPFCPVCPYDCAVVACRRLSAAGLACWSACSPACRPSAASPQVRRTTFSCAPSFPAALSGSQPQHCVSRELPGQCPVHSTPQKGILPMPSTRAAPPPLRRRHAKVCAADP